jgi:hypothetical protein
MQLILRTTAAAIVAVGILATMTGCFWAPDDHREGWDHRDRGDGWDHPDDRHDDRGDDHPGEHRQGR